ncbi:IS66 family transposase [Myxococcota bacterium]|nr:IS66 family transposase [Myxococcota bacterium]
MTHARPSKKSERETSVVTHVGELLATHEARDAVMAVVRQLVEENARLLNLRVRLKNAAETMTKDQLAFFVAQTAKIDATSTDQDLATAAAALDAAAQPVNAAVEEQRRAGAEAKKKAPKAPRGPRSTHEHLERILNPIPLEEGQRCCPKYHSSCVTITVETSTTLEFIPAKVVRRVDQREVAACQVCEGYVARPPAPNKIIEGGRYGPTLVATIIGEKFEDGVPLYRKRQQLLRIGFDMPYSSMVTQVETVADTFESVWRELKAVVLSSEVMHLDGTSLPVMTKSGLGNGVLWGMAGVSGDERVAAYSYCSNGEARARREPVSNELREEGPLDILDRRVGPVVVDAATAFDKAFTRESLVEVGCNMHARRYFVKALDSNDARAVRAVAAFQALYAIEDQIATMSPDEKRRLRAQRSRPIYDALLKWADVVAEREPPKSHLGRAVAYLRRHQVALTRFIDDGRLPIDNGLIERLHRRPAIVRNASLFAGSHEGGRRAAIILSVMASCRLAGVDPIAYVADVLPRLARGVVVRDVPSLLPIAWRREHGAHSLVRVAEATRFR